MEDIYVLEHIKELCKRKGWTMYKLAKESGVAHSALSTMLNKQHIPSMKTLIKICNGLGISLSQFFTEMDNVTDDQTKIIYVWNMLDDYSKELAKNYLYGLAHIPLPLPKCDKNKE